MQTMYERDRPTPKLKMKSQTSDMTQTQTLISELQRSLKPQQKTSSPLKHYLINNNISGVQINYQNHIIKMPS